jgi:arginine exporter protein ArgO
MKKILKVLGIIILLILVYAVVAILAFGKNYHYEKSIVINAPKEKVWEQVSSMKAFNQWNPWLKLDKNITLTYTGKCRRSGR